jgi:hypothetical protein
MCHVSVRFSRLCAKGPLFASVSKAKSKCSFISRIAYRQSRTILSSMLTLGFGSTGDEFHTSDLTESVIAGLLPGRRAVKNISMIRDRKMLLIATRRLREGRSCRSWRYLKVAESNFERQWVNNLRNCSLYHSLYHRYKGMPQTSKPLMRSAQLVQTIIETHKQNYQFIRKISTTCWISFSISNYPPEEKI